MYKIIRIQKNENSIFVGLKESGTEDFNQPQTNKLAPIAIAKIDSQHPSFALLMISQIGDFLKIKNHIVSNNKQPQTDCHQINQNLTISLTIDSLIENISLTNDFQSTDNTSTIEQNNNKLTQTPGHKSSQKNSFSKTITTEQKEQLIVALKTMSLTEFKKVFKELKISTTSTCDLGNTCAHLAAQIGRPDILQTLLDNETSLKTKNNNLESVGILLAKSTSTDNVFYSKKTTQYTSARSLLLNRYALESPDWFFEKNKDGLLFFSIAQFHGATDLLTASNLLKDDSPLKDYTIKNNIALTQLFNENSWNLGSQKNLIALAKFAPKTLFHLLEKKPQSVDFYKQPITPESLVKQDFQNEKCVLAILLEHLESCTQFSLITKQVNIFDVLEKFAEDLIVKQKSDNILDGFNFNANSISIEEILNKYPDDMRLLLLNKNHSKSDFYSEANGAPFLKNSYDNNWNAKQWENSNQPPTKQNPFGAWGAFLQNKTKLSLPLLSKTIGVRSMEFLIEKGCAVESEKQAKELLDSSASLFSSKKWKDILSQQLIDKLILSSAAIEQQTPTSQNLQNKIHHLKAKKIMTL